jgi:hypothetical protein
MKVWLDDVRYPLPGWDWVKSYDQAVTYFQINQDSITDASLDHDLGFPSEAMGSDLFDVIEFPYDNSLPTGYDFVKWIWEHNAWPSNSLGIHTANPAGSINMRAIIERYGPYSLKREFSSTNPNLIIWGVVYEMEI